MPAEQILSMKTSNSSSGIKDIMFSFCSIYVLNAAKLTKSIVLFVKTEISIFLKVLIFSSSQNSKVLTSLSTLFFNNILE